MHLGKDSPGGRTSTLASSSSSSSLLYLLWRKLTAVLTARDTAEGAPVAVAEGQHEELSSHKGKAQRSYSGVKASPSCYSGWFVWGQACAGVQQAAQVRGAQYEGSVTD